MGSALPSRTRTGTTSARPSGDAILRASVAGVAERFLVARGKAREQMPAQHQPARERRVEAAGQEQHRPRTDHAEGRGFAGRERDAVSLDVAEARERAHARVVAAAAGAADGDDRVGVVCSVDVFEFGGESALRSERAAAGRDRLRDEFGCRLDERSGFGRARMTRSAARAPGPARSGGGQRGAARGASGGCRPGAMACTGSGVRARRQHAVARRRPAR